MAFSYDLLPPVVPEILPAFVAENVPIFFSIGNSNQIKTIQYSLANQDPNIATTFGVTTSFYPSNQQQQQYGDHYFFINTNSFNLETYYKLQLRVSRNTYNSISQINIQNFSEWSSVCLLKKIKKPQVIINEMGEENSTVIKTIGVNFTTIEGHVVFPPESTEKLKNYQIRLYELNNEATDSTYEKISDSSSQLILQTDYLSPEKQSNYSFKYLLPISLPQSSIYKLIFKYITSSGFVGQSYFFFNSLSLNKLPNNFKIQIEPDTELGEMKIIISSKNTPVMENIVIRRSSSETNFSIWDDIKILQYNSQDNTTYSMTWNDKTIKSGIFYKYGVCILKENGSRGIFTQCQDPKECVFDDMYLMGNNKSLRIKYNPSITNFKYNLNESVQQTLGSQFPFIKRNGHNFYRSFTIGGLITSYMDTHSRSTVPASLNGDSLKVNIDQSDSPSLRSKSNFHISDSDSIFASSFVPGPLNSQIKNFTSKEQMYKQSISYYNKYNQKNDIQQYQDIIYEREFRQAVTQFLYKNDIKLFRSTQQGNILIKLTDISFTPMQQLGRQLYSFSATATEIDNYSIFNCDKYNIQTIGQYQKIKNIQIQAGQIEQNFRPNSRSSISQELLLQVYSYYTKNWKYLTKDKLVDDNAILGQQEEIFNVFINKIYNLQIEIDSPPAPVNLNQKGEIQYMNVLNKTSSHNYRNTPLGYILLLNDKKLFIKASLERRVDQKGKEKIVYVGRYDLPSDVTVTSLKLVGGTMENGKIVAGPPNVHALINYLVEIQVTKADLNIINLLHFENPGQIWGTFEPETFLKPEILRKVSFKYSTREPVNKTNNKISDKNLSVLTTYNRQLNYIWWANFESSPNAVVYIKTARLASNNTIEIADQFERHILANGYLNLNGLTPKLQTISYNKYDENSIYNLKDNEAEQIINEYILQGFITKEIQNYIEEKIKINNNSNTVSPAQTLKYLSQIDMTSSDIWHPDWVPSSGIQSSETNKIYVPEFFIDDFYFGGVHLTEKKNNNERIYYKNNNNIILRKTEFVYYDEDTVFNSYEEIENPKENVVYTVTVKNYELPQQIPIQNYISVTLNESTQKQIYYNSNWYLFDEEKEDVLCPVDAIVNYYYEGSYRKYQLV